MKEWPQCFTQMHPQCCPLVQQVCPLFCFHTACWAGGGFLQLLVGTYSYAAPRSPQSPSSFILPLFSAGPWPPHSHGDSYRGATHGKNLRSHQTTSLFGPLLHKHVQPDAGSSEESVLLWFMDEGGFEGQGGGCVCVGGAYFGSPSGSLLFMFLKTWNVLVERWISECFLRSKTKRCTPKKSDEDFQPFLWNFLLLKVKDVLFMGCWARVTLEKSGINCFVNEGRHAASCGEAGSWKWHCLYSEY